MEGWGGELEQNRRRGGEGEGQAQERDREDTRRRRVTETVRACLFRLWKGREGPGRRVAEPLALPPSSCT